MRELSAEDFAFVARLLHRRSGLVLTPEKSDLFSRRIKPVLGRFGLKAVAQLVQELRLGNDSIAQALTEAVTVNDTSFFRDLGQFTAWRDLLPKIVARRADSKRLRLWSAACATGQEPYSIAMQLDDMGLAAQGWMIDIFATDISGEALTRAEKGQYSAFEVQKGLSLEQLANNFTATEDGFVLQERLRRMVTFRCFNLLDSFGWLDDLDLVFCRNVLIYFDRTTKQDMLERIAGTLSESGLLLLGATESPQIYTAAFQELPGESGIYPKARPAAMRYSA